MTETHLRGSLLVLVLLCLANAFNIADRVLLGVVQEAIKTEFRLSDFQLGLLGGPAFAVLYSILSLPIARFAEHANRSLIVATAVALFSAMTAACGIAGSFPTLLLARIGVSVGEAGILPPALALISDRYPQERRTLAMSIFAVGGPVGAMLATLGAGVLAQAHGWRSAFLAFGPAGVILALLIAMLVKDVHGRSGGIAQRRILQVARHLAVRGTVRYICIAGALVGACGMFVVQYLTSFFVRVHGLTLVQGAMILAVMSGFGIAGSVLTGTIANRAALRSGPVIVAVALVVATPFYMLAFWLSSLPAAIACLMFAATCLNGYTGVAFATLSNVVPATMRATVIAVFSLTANLLGYAVGPPVFGKISDVIGTASMAHAGLVPGTCTAHPVLTACIAASGLGLRWALSLASLPLLGAAFCFWRAGRLITGELVED